MTATTGWRRAALAPPAALLALALLTGCPGGGRTVGLAPRTVSEAVERINANFAGYDETLSCSGLATFSFREADGTQRTFSLQDSRLFYRQPQYVRFSVKSLQGETVQVGSNDERYWVWVDTEPRRMWWGSWARIGQVDPNALPIPPGDLLDAMLLRPLPETLRGGLDPMLRVDGDDHRLIYVRLDGEGRVSGYRELRLKTSPPYLPVEIVDRSRDGVVLMRAALDRYEPVDGGPLLARRYKVEWPVSQSRFELELLTARFREDFGPEMFSTFPSNWKHEQIRLDPPPAVPARDAAPPPRNAEKP